MVDSIKMSETARAKFRDKLIDAGVNEVRKAGDGYLITFKKCLTTDLKKRINKAIKPIASIAKPETGEQLFACVHYRTFVTKEGYEKIALVFRNIYTGQVAERWFNIDLKDGNGRLIKTGKNCKFKIIGEPKAPRKGSFIKFWTDVFGELPFNRKSEIPRSMGRLKGVAVSSIEQNDGNGIIWLCDIKFEGYFCE